MLFLSGKEASAGRGALLTFVYCLGLGLPFVLAGASVAMAALARGEEAVTLRRGLESNREIGKAIGLMMAMHDISDEAAFAMLAKVSQEMNIKLAEVAARVISHHRGES